jgi:hypothetical protein
VRPSNDVGFEGLTAVAVKISSEISSEISEYTVIYSTSWNSSYTVLIVTLIPAQISICFCQLILNMSSDNLSVF